MEKWKAAHLQQFLVCREFYRHRESASSLRLEALSTPLSGDTGESMSRNVAFFYGGFQESVMAGGGRQSPLHRSCDNKALNRPPVVTLAKR
jgi:hypothetical protein